MALTHHLKSKESPVRQFLEQSAPRLLLAGSRGSIGREVAEEFGFQKLTAHGLVVPIPEAVTDKRSFGAPVGTAFDYRARMMLGTFVVEETTAIDGLRYFQANTKGIRWARHMAKVLAEATELAAVAAEHGDERDRDILSVVLAWCESFYRAGVYTVTQSSLGKQLRNAQDGAALIASIDPLMLIDLAALRQGSERQITEWSNAVAGGSRLELNPVFAGSGAVGGADADWLVGDTLIDCKATERLGNSWIRGTLFQLLGYSLLDWDDSLAIRRVAIWLPRRRALQAWSLDDLLGVPAEEALFELRANFEATLRTWHEQLAEEARVRREMWTQWREAMEAKMAAEAEADAFKAEERKARRREYDRKRREAKKGATAEGEPVPTE